MSSAPSRSSDSFSLWLLISAVAVIAGALFSASRTKPPMIFLPAFGAAMGLLLRLAAAWLGVERNRRMVMAAMLLIGCGAIGSFVPSYRRAVQSNQPPNALAAAILAQAAKENPEAATPPFTVHTYLSQRFFNLASPWPELQFGAEWLVSVVIAGLCVGIGQGRERERPVANSVADASGSEGGSPS